MRMNIHPILVTLFLVVFGNEVTKILRNSLFSFHLALQTENLIQKVTQPKAKLPKYEMSRAKVSNIYRFWAFSSVIFFLKTQITYSKNRDNFVVPGQKHLYWFIYFFSFRWWGRNWSTKCYWFFKSYKSLWWPFNFLAQSHQKFWRNWSATFNENVKAKEESISKFVKGSFEK